MASKLDILNEVGRRLGNTTTPFINTLDPIFDYVMRELAGLGALPVLNAEASFSLVANQASYNILTITGISTPPARTFRLTVPSFPYPDGILVRLDGALFESRKLRNTTAGRPKWWRLYPNVTTLEVIPKPDAANAVTAVLWYTKPPTTLTQAQAVTEIEEVFWPVLIAGIQAYAAPHLDETTKDQQVMMALYRQGIQTMVARASTAYLPDTQIGGVVASLQTANRQ